MISITAISDTHNKHDQLILGTGDILIHCGDFTTRGRWGEFDDFTKWFVKQNFKYKCLVFGNHDFNLKERQDVKDRLEEYGIICLTDKPVNNIMGLSIQGGDFTPSIRNGVYMWHSEDIDVRRKAWEHLRSGIDILVTHAPPRTVLDLNKTFEHCGCDMLLEKVKQVKPTYHLFGHIHSHSLSTYDNKTTKFYNCAFLDEDYKIINELQYQTLNIRSRHEY